MSLKQYDLVEDVWDHDVHDVCTTEKGEKLFVSLLNKDVDVGMIVPKEQAAACPTVQFHVEPNELYTLAMVDPDAPSRQDPRMREWRHWLVCNMKDCNPKNGTVLTEWAGPTPPAGTGPHRYVFLLFKQHGKTINVTESDKRELLSGSRGKFRLQKWAQTHGLQDPIAMNYFLTQNS
jgi:phosphatidylethanolamine-binding protein (PEBP) family uncharacterized protein